jgi:energy-coupling factor transporter ATP-binding protein EcfA2
MLPTSDRGALISECFEIDAGGRVNEEVAMTDRRAINDGVAQQIQEFFRSTIDPIRTRAHFTQRPSDGSLRADPMVVFVGNHSSGKSTFINHLLGASVQETGMAPTHDDFTVLVHGDTAREITGDALLSNADHGFSELAGFGVTFARRIKMRAGPYPILRDVRLVDTPGMIDSADRESRRDYDFDGVVAWLAQRADLVVLFFDPERPGTTAETVDVFARKLSLLDHKLVVVFSKVDQFRNVTDFARCYGTLCWNLGKVLRTKDLPQIHPCYLKVEGAPAPAIPLAEFDAPRERLLERIKKAPDQRADNLLTETARYIEGLIAHAEVLDRLRERALAGPRRASLYGFFAIVIVLVFAGLWLGPDSDDGWWERTKGATVGLAVVGALIVAVVATTSFARRRSAAGFVERLDAEFERAVSGIDESARLRGTPADRTRQSFEAVRDITTAAARSLAPWNLPKFRGSDRRSLEKWLDSTLAELRRYVHRGAS